MIERANALTGGRFREFRVVTIKAETRAAFASVLISTYAGSDFNDLCISGGLRTNQTAAIKVQRVPANRARSPRV